MLDAAYRLFCERGFEATTVQAIAKEAQVAVQTVYFTFGSKARLLAEVANRAILGDAPSETWREQPWATSLREEQSPIRLLRLFIDIDAEIKGRLAPLVSAVAPVLATRLDPTGVAEHGQDEFFGSVVDRLDELGALRPGLGRARALDILRVTNSLSAFTELIVVRHWTADEWKAWLLDHLTHQLLKAPPKSTRRPRP